MCSSLNDQEIIQAEGEMSTVKGTVNSMVDLLSAFASEVTRVALGVGTQGILGGQARVEEFTKAVAAGDLTKFVNVDVQGKMLDLGTTVNSMVSQPNTLANEVTRVSLEVGTEGILGGQATVPGVQGMRKMRFNLLSKVNLDLWIRSCAFSAVVAIPPTSSPLESPILIVYTYMRISMRIHHLITLSLTCLDCRPPDLQALTDTVNLMAMSHTNQVLSIAQVTKAVPGGDLTKKIDFDPRAEILEWKETVNGLPESLSVFAYEMARIAREVGTEGRLGGQARATSVVGTSKDCADNVNVMANNLP
ncbi:hypothetical protein DFP72DRAFT_1082051 [Ephemerocybe angulata]|uniref:Uncharacterized protein n=1 Tax=Ephemerocybe angulata TaxID=980116 RepID=A0A8H6H9H5_9AGAR|nr:hypothetical protein DFP72DRAFT_1082051 [Tulosesus angulatus]